jgi:hypothetical protein
LTESDLGRLNGIMLGPDIRELSRGPGWLFASWQDAYILDWRAPISRENLDASSVCVEKVTSRFPAGIAIVNILHATMRMPPSDMREYAQKKLQDSSPLVRCHAAVLNEKGFWSGAMRAGLAGLYMVQKTPFPRKVFGENEEAVEWCREVLGHDAAWKQGVLTAIESVTRAGGADQQ